MAIQPWQHHVEYDLGIVMPFDREVAPFDAACDIHDVAAFGWRFAQIFPASLGLILDDRYFHALIIAGDGDTEITNL